MNKYKVWFNDYPKGIFDKTYSHERIVDSYDEAMEIAKKNSWDIQNIRRLDSL